MAFAPLLPPACLLVSLSVVACSTTKEEPAPPNEMRWTVVSAGATPVNETTATAQVRAVGNALEVSGVVAPNSPTQKTVLLHIPTAAAGKYVIGNSQVEAAATYKLLDNGQEVAYFVDNHRSGGGNITVTALTATRIEGTFEFKAYNTPAGSTTTTDRYLYDGTFRVRR